MEVDFLIRPHQGWPPQRNARHVRKMGAPTHGWFLDRLGNLRFSCTCTIILSRPTWEPLIFPHLRGFLSRQNTGKSNFPRSHRFSRVRGWKPRISHTCTVPIADGHGSPKFLALSLGGSRRGRTWKPEVSHTCDFGRFPFAVVGFPRLRFWAVSVAAGHGNHGFPMVALLGGFRCGRTWKPPGFSRLCLGGFRRGRTWKPPTHGRFRSRATWKPRISSQLQRFSIAVVHGNPEFRRNYGGFPSRSCTETPNFVATTEVFHRGRTRKLGASHHTQTISLAVGHGNPVFPTLGRFFSMVGHGNPKFPVLALLGASRRGRARRPQVSCTCTRAAFAAWSTMETPQVSRPRTWAGAWKPKVSHDGTFFGRTDGNPNLPTLRNPGCFHRPAGRGNPKFPTLAHGQRPSPDRTPIPCTWAASLSTGSETPNSPTHLGGGYALGRPGNPKFPTLALRADGWKPPVPHASQSGRLPSPGRPWKPQVSHTRTWAASVARPDVETLDSLHLGGFALDRPGNLEFPLTLGRRIRSRSAWKTRISPHAWAANSLSVGPENPKFSNAYTWGRFPSSTGVENPNSGGFSVG